MGLPLFVAPVESDLPSKSADKSSATSPSRSGIRRYSRPDPRDRRAALRRHMSIRDRLANNSLRQSSLRAPDQFDLLSEPATMENFRRPRPFREVLREVVRSDTNTRERFEEHLQHLFGGSSVPNREVGESVDEPGASLGFWAVEPIAPYSRNRPPASSSPWATWSSRQDEAESRSSMPRRYTHVFQPRGPLVPETEAQRSRRVAESHARSTAAALNAESMHNAALGRFREANGLGDRERSLSPEVWDTLLTTLTPDPQAPSAGSSFASTVASQSAGVSSGTTLTTPEAATGDAADQACESGCENSDSDGVEFDFGRIRRRREARRVRVRVPEYNLDGPVDGPVDGPLDGPVDGPIDGRVDAPAERSLEQLRAVTAWDSERRTSSEARRAMEDSTNNTVGHGNLSLSQFRRPRHGWIGQMSVGTSDDDITDRRSLNRESSATSGNNASLGDEEWAGMQHIVRSLARREDIPDEWWAEAGLSRTIP